MIKFATAAPVISTFRKFRESRSSLVIVFVLD
jgi:hypothetical protein